MNKKIYPVQTYLFFLEAWIMLSFAKIILLYVPFRKIAPRLKSNFRQPAKKVGVIRYCEEIAYAVRRAGRYIPWRTRCFEQAIAGKMMLNRRNLDSELYIGVCKKEKAVGIVAHAWLKSGGRIITGGTDLEKFSIISVF